MRIRVKWQVAVFFLCQAVPRSLPASVVQSAVQVEVNGLRAPERRNVLIHLSIASSLPSDSLAADRMAVLHERAPEEIAAALEPFGYYQPVVDGQLTRSGTRWAARYEVRPGPRVTVRNLTIRIIGDGASEPRILQVRSAFPLATGAPLIHPDYELGKSRFMSAAAELGYLDAGFDERRVAIDRVKLVADVTLVFNTGPRYQFGSTSFPGQEQDSSLARQFITYAAGDAFDGGVLLALQIALAESPYFERAEIIPRRDLTTDIQVPVEIHLTPRPFQTYEIGGGYGTNSGARGSVGIKFPRLSRGGLRMESELLVSQLERSLTGRFTLPPRSPTGFVLTNQGAYARRTVSTSTSETVLLSTSLSRTRGPWQESVGITYQHEAFSIGADTGLSTLTVPTIVLSRTRANNRVFPTTAQRFRVELQAARRGLGADASFVRLRGRAIGIRSAGRFRVLARAEGGATFTEAFRSLPPSIRFFTGGDNSVRGFAYRELGPRDVNDEPVGGRFLAVASGEIEYSFFNQWAGAIFSDIGNAFTDLPIKLEQGMGLGIRWRSPVGLLRLDGAFAVTRMGRPFRLHLLIGPDL